ncbi:MAG: beta-glucosidase BglX [Salinivirgaceae bacterium]|nr:beta-glucosidase BglX [Salinivirgaceae bacterium]
MKIQSHLYIFIIFFSILFSGCHSEQKQKIGKSEYQQKIDSLIKIMTLDEKIGQLNLLSSGWDITGPTMDPNFKQFIKQGKVGAIFNALTVEFVTELQRLAVEETRLGIPLLFGYDVVHGYRTIFPIPLAQSCSWDLSMIEQSERIAATEASAEGINWTFAPMVDISRDPRWGRVSEGAGEDTWLGSQMGAARVKGFQGKDMSDANTILACVKHFAAYGAPEAGRDYNTVDMSERTLFEYYLPPYKACIDAGAGSIMTSFNEISGVPSSSNRWLFTELLRNKWGFIGFVVTDYASIFELIPHGVASDSAMAGELALHAGIEMDMQSTVFINHLKKSLENEKITLKEIDDAVKNILMAKYNLGLFDDPYRYCNAQREKEELLTPVSQQFARDFVTKSCVLLKNENQTLPIPANIKKIALIGPLANSKEDMLGSWSASGKAVHCITLLEALEEKATKYNFKIEYAEGCQIQDPSVKGFARAMHAAKSADFVILALGEHRNMSGEAASRTNINLPEVQQELANKLIALDKPLAVVLFNGRPLTITELNKTAPAILETWFGGTQAGNGIADVLFGEVIPSGKLTMTFPREVGQIPIHYNVKNTGRPIDPKNPEYKYRSKYIDCPNEPLYPFGYGLSYTQFEYSNLTIDKPELSKSDTLHISIEVSNTGNYDGFEIVQLYTRDLVGSVTRPIKELKGFKKVFIPKGQKDTVTFKLTPRDLKFYNLKMKYVWEPGEFLLFVGPNSISGLSAEFRIL